MSKEELAIYMEEAMNMSEECGTKMKGTTVLFQKDKKENQNEIEICKERKKDVYKKGDTEWL